MLTPFPSLLVSPAELHAALSNASSRRIIPVAAGQPSHLPSLEAQHIPGSILFNMEEIRDTASTSPQMLPSASKSAKCMTELGIQPDDILVVYDVLEVGFYSSPRVAWACRHFGQRDVHVLNNFPRYIKEGFPVASGPLTKLPPAQQDYPVKELDPQAVIAYKELHQLLSSKAQDQFQIIDARISGRFSGEESELNPALRSGHMPHALNVPLASILDDDKVMLSADELKTRFESAGVDGKLPVVLTCNSGVTAAALDLALQLSGYGMERRLYDGSWMEWTRRAQDEGMVVTDSYCCTTRPGAHVL